VLAASLVVPALSQDAAAAFAEAEGLVTHLTSLVLIDEAGEAQQSVPAMRKVALPSPRTHVHMQRSGSGAVAFRASLAVPDEFFEREFGSRRMPVASTSKAPRESNGKLRRRASKLAGEGLSGILGLIDWDRAPQKLQSGDLSALPVFAARAIRNAAAKAEVTALATTLCLDPIVLVIGLLAYTARSHRTAARIARAIFGGEPPAAARTLLLYLGPEAA
jgi:hypothetical protein